MQATILNSSILNANGSTYFNIEVLAGKQAVNVLIVSGARPYLNIQVKNASHRVWRGGGKDFATVAAATANYKSPSVISAIHAAAQLAGI